MLGLAKYFLGKTFVDESFWVNHLRVKYFLGETFLDHLFVGETSVGKSFFARPSVVF